MSPIAEDAHVKNLAVIKPPPPALPAKRAFASRRARFAVKVQTLRQPRPAQFAGNGVNAGPAIPRRRAECFCLGQRRGKRRCFEPVPAAAAGSQEYTGIPNRQCAVASAAAPPPVCRRVCRGVVRCLSNRTRETRLCGSRPPGQRMFPALRASPRDRECFCASAQTTSKGVRPNSWRSADTSNAC